VIAGSVDTAAILSAGRRACITGRANSARRCVETQLPHGPNRTISESSTRSEPSGSDVTQTR
jgi:hypothetical protein